MWAPVLLALIGYVAHTGRHVVDEVGHLGHVRSHGCTNNNHGRFYLGALISHLNKWESGVGGLGAPRVCQMVISPPA